MSNNTTTKHTEVTMSNNKQSMKLYTEIQVRQMLEVCRDSDLYEHILTFEDILKTETPIELPSDEEIEEQSWGYREVTKDMEIPPNEDWSNGAKWMRDKIQGGNK
jgi:hypothetical protein